MTTTKLESPKDVTAMMNFYLEPSEGGHTSFVAGLAASYRRRFDAHQVKIYDIKGREDSFNFDKNGFQLVRDPIDVNDLEDRLSIPENYYPGCVKLLKRVTGATRVIPISNIVRTVTFESALEHIKGMPDEEPVNLQTPGIYVHLDQSPTGAIQYFRDNVSEDDFDRLSKTRWAIINIWRPLKPVERDPLAMCDSNTVQEQDLVGVPVILPTQRTLDYALLSAGKGFELHYARYNPNQRWYYASGMDSSEALLLKIFDSKKFDGRRSRAPHSSFIDPSSKADAPTRESIEVRCLVFWENETIE